MAEFNPYAPPIDAPHGNIVAPGPGGDQTYGVWREGDALVMPAGGAHLPDRCVVCNKPSQHRWRKTFAWHPPWVYLFLLISLLVYIIVALITRKSANLELPLCDEHKKRRTNGIIIGWGGTLAMLALGIGGAVAEIPALAIIGFAGILVPIIAGVIMANIVRVKKIDKTHAWMKLGHAYLDTVPASPMLPPPGTPPGQLPPGGWGTPL